MLLVSIRSVWRSVTKRPLLSVEFYFRVHNNFNPWQNSKSLWIQIEHGQRWKLYNLLWSKISKTRKWKLVNTSYFAPRNESKWWNSNSRRKAIIFPVESRARADSQFSPEEWVRLVRLVFYREVLRDQWVTRWKVGWIDHWFMNMICSISDYSKQSSADMQRIISLLVSAIWKIFGVRFHRTLISTYLASVTLAKCVKIFLSRNRHSENGKKIKFGHACYQVYLSLFPAKCYLNWQKWQKGDGK